ncbi:hypothetical protein L596_023799 [Steinernema carpocapsae]|uniref:Uncharacterized protein n=1 Tax=Steinernema carpocapsae TaxID=34508 RepID=A0A4U5MER5_STECR|nr:hypothetical protein L596_023799 [Steinernema carpocapsae]
MPVLLLICDLALYISNSKNFVYAAHYASGIYAALLSVAFSSKERALHVLVWIYLFIRSEVSEGMLRALDSLSSFETQLLPP